jgi:hypothetical protein
MELKHGSLLRQEGATVRSCTLIVAGVRTSVSIM